MPDRNGAAWEGQSTLAPGPKPDRESIAEYMTRRGLKGGVGLDPHEPVSPTPLPADRQGSRYDIGELVARGGMGAILAAKDLNILRRVAMKVMLPGQEAAPAQVVRFVEEAQVTGQLEHPNIVPVHELSVDDQDHVFYTMKLVHGVTLKEVLQKLAARDPDTLARYPLSALLTIFLKACDAVAFAHAKGVIHRDLKPENVMVGEFGEVLVMDWGLAKVLGSRQDGASAEPDRPDRSENADGPAIESTREEPGEGVLHTLDGQILGTPQFMAPEQAEGRIGEIDARADIYALGAILYTILVLRPPVEGGTVADVLLKVSEGRITPATAVRTSPPAARQEGDPPSRPDTRPLTPDTSPFPHCPGGHIPEALSAVAMKALALRPEARYASVKDLQAEIERYQSGFATLAEHAGLGRQLALLVRRHRGFVTAAALVFATVVVGLVVSLVQWRRADRNEKQAVAAKGEAEDARDEAEKRRDQAEYASYRALIGLAQGYLAKGDALRARTALTRCPTRFRHWEWGFLSRECRRTEESTDRNGVAYGQVAMSADGRRVAWPVRDGSVVVEGVAGGERTAILPKTEGIRLTGFTPDGELLATLAMAGTNATTGVLEVYRVSTGERLWQTEVPAGPECQMAVSPATPYVVAGGSHSGAASPPFSLVDLRSGKVIASLGGTDGRAKAAAWTPDGKGVWWSSENLLHLYDVHAATEVRQMGAGPDGAWFLAVSPDGRRIASASGSGSTARLRDIASGDQIAPFWHPATVNAILFAAAGRYLLGGGPDGTLCVWETATGGLAGMAHGPPVFSLAGTPGCETLYVGTATEGVRRTSLGEVTGKALTDRLTRLLEWPSGGPVCFTRAGDHLLYAPVGKCALLTPDGLSASRILRYTRGEAPGSVAWDGDVSAPVAAGFGNGDVHVWDLRTATLVHEFKGDRQGYAWSTVCWIEPGKVLAAGGQTGAEVSLYDAEAGTLVRRLDTGLTLVLSLALSPDRRSLYVGGGGGLAAFDTTTWQPVPLALSPRVDFANAIAFAPNGEWLAVSAVAGGVAGTRLWRTDQSEMHACIEGVGVWRLAFTADGRRLAADTGEASGTITLIDTERGTSLLTLTDHGSGVVGGLAFSADSRRLASTVASPKRPFLSREADPWESDGSAAHGQAPETAADQPAETRAVPPSVTPPAEGQPWTVPELGLELVWVTPGRFQMGSASGEPDEKPVHAVRLTHGFWLGKCEVTQAEYQSITGSNPSGFADGPRSARNPVELVSFDAAMAFCAKLTEREQKAGRLPALSGVGGPAGYEYRLPTEAEWEYAARGGTSHQGYAYSGSDSVDEAAWHLGNSAGQPHPVGQKKANGLGLCDMSGNVYEWCLDLYDPQYYQRSPEADPVNLQAAPSRAFRGGSWLYDGIWASPTKRVGWPAEGAGINLGFRICLGPRIELPTAEPAAEPRLTETQREAAALNSQAWPVVAGPGSPSGAVARALGQATQAVALAPQDAAILNTLGVAQYRAGWYEEALATLGRAEALNAASRGPTPEDLAFIAMAQWKLNRKDAARATLAALRELLRADPPKATAEAQGFLHEAETLIGELHPATR